MPALKKAEKNQKTRDRYARLVAERKCIRCKRDMRSDEGVECRKCLDSRKCDAPPAKRSNAFIGDFCIIPLGELTEMLGVEIEYEVDSYRLTGAMECVIDRGRMDPYDALRSVGLLDKSKIESIIKKHRDAMKIESIRLRKETSSIKSANRYQARKEAV